MARRREARVGCSTSSSPRGAGELRRVVRGSAGGRDRGAGARPGRGEVPIVLRWYDAIVATVTVDHRRHWHDARRAGGVRRARARRLEDAITARRSDVAARAPPPDLELSHDQIASERRGAAVRRDRDDRGDDRQRDPAAAQATPMRSRGPAEPALLDAADRGVAAARAGGRRDRPLRDRRHGARRRPRSRAASSSGCRSAPPTATRTSSTHPDRFDLTRANARAPPRVRPGAARVRRRPPRAARGAHGAGRAAGAAAGPPPGSRRPAEVRGLVFRKPVALHVCVVSCGSVSTLAASPAATR